MGGWVVRVFGGSGWEGAGRVRRVGLYHGEVIQVSIGQWSAHTSTSYESNFLKGQRYTSTEFGDQRQPIFTTLADVWGL